MGDERELKIKITTAADTSGAKQTAAELGNLGTAQEEAGKKAEKHGASLHAMHRIFHSLNEVVPGLGVALQAAFSPIGAAISLAVIALRLFQEKMKETNAEFQKLEEEAAKPATNRMAAWREAIVRAAEGMNHLRQALADAARGQETIKETTEHTTAAFHEQMQAASTLADAVKENELAGLEEMHAAGLVSEEQYAQQRLEIEEQYQAKKRELQEREEMTEILIKKRALEQAEMAQPGLTSAAEAAELKKVGALENLGSLDKAGVEERKKSTQAALDAWEKKLGNADLLEEFTAIGGGKTQGDADRWMRANAGRFSAGYHTSGANRYMEWDALRGAAAGAAAEWKQFPGEEARRKVAADMASDEAARAERAAVGNQEFIGATGRDIGDRRSRFDSRHQANQEIEGLESDTLARRKTAALLGSPEGKLVQDAVAGERTQMGGGHATTMQQAQIATLAAQHTRANEANIKDILNAMLTLAGSDQQNKAAIAQLRKQLRNQASPL